MTPKLLLLLLLQLFFLRKKWIMLQTIKAITLQPRRSVLPPFSPLPSASAPSFAAFSCGSLCAAWKMVSSEASNCRTTVRVISVRYLIPVRLAHVWFGTEPNGAHGTVKPTIITSASLSLGSWQVPAKRPRSCVCVSVVVVVCLICLAGCGSG